MREMTEGFSESEITAMNSILEDKIPEKEMNELKIRLKSSGTDRTVLAKLFIECHDYFIRNIQMLPKSKQAKLTTFLSMDFTKDLRNFLEEYGDGFQPHGYFTQMKIQNLVDSNRTKTDALVELFFKVFEER